jgi:hypothetical protein
VPASATAAPNVQSSPAPDPFSSVHYAKKRIRPRYWQPLADGALESLAVEAYCQINHLTTNPHEKVSLVSTRKWAATYGERRLRSALVLLQQRSHIHKPAGFVATVLRTSS